MTPSRASRIRLPDGLVIVLMALLIGLQPIATDLYLPALPLLRNHFDISVEITQLTLSVLIIFFGLSQLVWGPISDRHGRKPVLLGGLMLYTAGALAGAAASSITILVVARGIQGIGLAAVMVCARAMVRDLYEPAEGTPIVSRAMSLLACLAALTPGIGGLIATNLGWRSTLLATGIVSVCLLALHILRVPESFPGPDREATKIRPLVATYLRIARHPTFITWTALSTFGYAANVGFFSSSSYIYIHQFNISPQVFGLVLGSGSLAYFLGTIGCRRSLAAWGLPTAIRFAGAVSLLSMLMFIVPALFATHTAWSLTAGLWINLFAYGYHQPCGHVGMIAAFPSNAGSASALGGCLLAIGAFFGATVNGYAYNGTAVPLACITGALVGASALIALAFTKRYGEIKPSPVNRLSPSEGIG